MRSLKPRLWIALAVVGILAPTRAPAQTVAVSLEELPQLLMKGHTDVVTETRGQQTKGNVTTDALWNGALIGAGIGAGLATWDYLIDPSEPGNAAVFTVAIGLGTAIGAGIDALLSQRNVLHPSPRQSRSLLLTPFVAKDRQGALISVRF